MRYRLMATYRGVPYEAGVGPSNSDVVLFAACPPPEALGFEPATGHWRKQVIRAEIDALWESRPVGVFRGEPCIVLDDLGDRLHIAYLGADAERAGQLGYWQVDRGVFEVLTPKDEVTGLTEERVDRPLRWTEHPASSPARTAYPYGTAPWPTLAPPASAQAEVPGPGAAAPAPASAPAPANPAGPPAPAPGPADGLMSAAPPAAGPYPSAGPQAPADPHVPADPYLDKPAAQPLTAPPMTGPATPSPRLPSRRSPAAAAAGQAGPPATGVPSPALPAHGPIPDAPGPDAPRPDAPRPDAPRPDAPRPDAPRPDAPAPTGPAMSGPDRANGAWPVPDALSGPGLPPPDAGGQHGFPEPGYLGQAHGGGPAGPSAGDAGGRAGRRQRVPTREIFCELADLASIPRSAYALETEMDGAMCLVPTPDGFEVFTAADGARHEVRTFAEEEAAYFYLFGVLAAEAIRNGALAPAVAAAGLRPGGI
jgi:hypothetical protein